MNSKLINVKPNSVIESVGYNYKEQKLIILFKSGKLYVYFNVLLTEYFELLETTTPGKSFHDYIYGKYDSIEEDKYDYLGKHKIISA